MTFDDLGCSFKAPEWSAEEIEQAITDLKKRLPKIRVVYDPDETGVHIGLEDEEVMIQKCYMDKAGNEIHCPSDSNSRYRETDDDKVMPYHGKLYDGYWVIGSGNVLGKYSKLNVAVDVALAVYHVIVATLHNNKLPISVEANKTFSLGEHS